MRSTFGAPLGASTGLGKSGVDSLAVRPILPLNGGSGRGRTLGSLGPPPGTSADARMTGLYWAFASGVSRPEATSQPNRPLAATNRAAARCIRLNMVLLLGENRPRRASPRRRWVNRSDPVLNQSERLADGPIQFQSQVGERRGFSGRNGGLRKAS